MEGLRNYCNGFVQRAAQRAAQTGAYQYYDQKCQDLFGKNGETVLQITGVATSALMILGLTYMTPIGTGIDLVVGTLPVGHNFVVGLGEVIKMVLELVFKDLLGGAAHFIFSDVIGGGLGVIGQAIGVLGSLVSVSFQGAVTAAIVAALIFGYRVDNFFNAPAPEPLPVANPEAFVRNPVAFVAAFPAALTAALEAAPEANPEALAAALAAPEANPEALAVALAAAFAAPEANPEALAAVLAAALVAPGAAQEALTAALAAALAAPEAAQEALTVALTAALVAAPVANPLPAPQAAFNPAPYPGGDRFNIHHARWYYVEAREMARSAYRNGLQGIQFVRHHMDNKPAVKYAVHGILGVTAATYAIALAAISLTIIAGLVRATANFIGAVMYSGYTLIKGCVQAIWYCCKAVVNVALDVMSAFWNTIKVPFCVVRDGAYSVGSATYNSVLKPTGAAIVHVGKTVGSGIYSAGVTIKDRVGSLAGRVSLFQGTPKPADLFPPREALIPQG